MVFVTAIVFGLDSRNRNNCAIANPELLRCVCTVSRLRQLDNHQVLSFLRSHVGLNREITPKVRAAKFNNRTGEGKNPFPRPFVFRTPEQTLVVLLTCQLSKIFTPALERHCCAKVKDRKGAAGKTQRVTTARRLDSRITL